jgi:hypothetical protein
MNPTETTPISQPPSTAIVAVTGAGALYTTDFIPKFIDKGAAMFVLTNDGVVHIYNSSGEVALELPAVAVQPTKIGGASLKTELNLNGQPYIFRLDPNASNPIFATSAVIGSTVVDGIGLFLAVKAQERTKAFFDALSNFQTAQPNTQVPNASVAQTTTLVGGQIMMPNQSAQPAVVEAMTSPQAASQVPGIVPNDAIRKTLRKRATIYTILGALLTIWGGLSVLGTLVETFPLSEVITSWAYLIAGLVLLFRGITGFIKNKA